MPKKTVSLLLFLGVLTVLLLVLAFYPQYASQQLSHTKSVTTVPITPTISSPAQTVLSFSKDPILVSSPTSEVDLIINTGINKVSAIEIELGFDPKLITNMRVTPGSFFSNPTIFRNEVKPNGTLSYILALPPSELPKKGTGIVAKISFTHLLATGQQTPLTFLSKTEVSAEGIDGSVLKLAKNGIILKASSSAAPSITP